MFGTEIPHTGELTLKEETRLSARVRFCHVHHSVFIYNQLYGPNLLITLMFLSVVMNHKKVLLGIPRLV